MMLVSIVGHASFHTTGRSGPSTIDRSNFRRWPVAVVGRGSGADGVVVTGAADRPGVSTAGRVTGFNLLLVTPMDRETGHLPRTEPSNEASSGMTARNT